MFAALMDLYDLLKQTEVDKLRISELERELAHAKKTTPVQAS